MVTHTFICAKCDQSIDDTQAQKEHFCPKCGEDMAWDLSGIGISDGDYHHVSDSLAIHPDQIPEHRELFPDIEVTPDGCPTFTSPKQQEKYANACDFDKKPQRGRKLGRVIL